jgi:hypothetical protein
MRRYCPPNTTCCNLAGDLRRIVGFVKEGRLTVIIYIVYVTLAIEDNIPILRHVAVYVL